MKRISLVLLAASMFLLLILLNPESGEVQGDYSIHTVAVGGEKAHVVIVHNTSKTATMEGMDATLRRVAGNVAESAATDFGSRPDVLIVQPGLGSSAYDERRSIARMALRSDKDFAISIDMSDRFKWPWESGDLRMVAIEEPVTRRFERLVSSANRVWGRPADVVLESQATRFLFPGTLGSVTAADLCEEGRLHERFRLNRVVCVGVPLRDVQVGRSLRENRIADIVAITTPQIPAVIGAAPIEGEESIEVTLRNGKPVRHKHLFRERWPDGRMNPIPQLVGEYLR